MIGIYKITNIVNGKVYIGQSIDIEERWAAHVRISNKYKAHLYDSIKKYGIENFKFEVLLECLREDLNEAEKILILNFRSYDPEYGYNKTMGGEGGIPTLEAKINMSKSQKGKKQSIETIKKRVKKNKGKKRSEEFKKKMSELSIGRKYSDETIKRMSEAKKGKTSPRKGITLSQETRKKISDSKRRN